MAGPCKYEGGQFINTCTALDDAWDRHFVRGKARGLFRSTRVNIKTDARRDVMILRDGKFNNGILLNFCPFCGSSILEEPTS